MLPPINLLRSLLIGDLDDRERQGHRVEGLVDELRALPDSYDRLWEFALRLRDLPVRADWPWHEPDDLAGIHAACDPERETAPIAAVDPEAIAPRVAAAFLASVCGCILGKPLEVSTTGHRIRAAAESVGQWPLDDYVTEELLVALGARHGDAIDTRRGHIAYVACDDDLNYSIMGMLLLERHGVEFTREQQRWLWLQNLPLLWQWGPERSVNLRSAQQTMWRSKDPVPFDEWVEVCNPGSEACGAAIRADAYGFACPGDPARAAALAWRDASFTHRRTGIYATMFNAAAIAAAFVEPDPLRIVELAARQVPRRSRFRAAVDESLDLVRSASDWWDGYSRVHRRFEQHGHCQVYQETGTMINTLRFARDVAEGIGMQVGQGNDTDSYGCTAGAILGARFGRIDPRWLAPFGDRIHTTIAGFHEQRLGVVAERFGRLPARLAAAAAAAKENGQP